MTNDEYIPEDYGGLDVSHGKVRAERARMERSGGHCPQCSTWIPTGHFYTPTAHAQECSFRALVRRTVR